MNSEFLNNDRPVGRIKPIKAISRGEPKNNHAVLVWVICEDEKGQKWKFKTSALSVDMEPYNE